jgi:hypothetical protein
VQNRLPNRLAKAAESQLAPVNLEDVSPIEFLKDKTKGIGVLRATGAVAGAVVISCHLPAGCRRGPPRFTRPDFCHRHKGRCDMLREVIRVLGGTR